MVLAIMETEQSDSAERNSFRAESIVTLAQLPLRPQTDSVEAIQAYIELIRSAENVNTEQKTALLGKRQQNDERRRARRESEDRKIKEVRKSHDLKVQLRRQREDKRYEKAFD